jgi:hypothetical protein
MNQTNIFALVDELEREFLDKPAKIVDNYYFDQFKTLKKIHMYYNSQFVSGKNDKQGEKYFFNIVKSRVKNATKNIDLDTKDINVRTTKGQDKIKTMLYRRDIVRWMKERKLGKVINEIAAKCPRYGSVVVKRVKNENIFEIVDLRNIKCEKTASNLNNSWVIEDHYMTPHELLEMSSWDRDAVMDVVNNYISYQKANYVDYFDENSDKIGMDQYIHVREFSGWIPETMYYDNGTGTEGEYIRAHKIMVLPEKSVGLKSFANSNSKQRMGKVLFKEELKTDLYKEVHYDKADGRWMGVGIVEDLFDLQTIKNREVNYILLGLKLANLILLQTRDKKIASNILTMVKNGEILKVKNEVNRINTDIRSTGAESVISNEIENLANKLSNSPEITTGNTLPSGTPLGLGDLYNENANKLFDFVRENLGLFLTDVFNDWVLPELAKDLNKEHILELVDEEEIKAVVENFEKKTVWNGIKEYLINTGGKISKDDVKAAMEIMKERSKDIKKLTLEVMEDYYKDVKGKVEFNITNENENKQQLLESYKTILQLIGNNPALNDHPLFKEMLDMIGLSPAEVPPLVQPQMQNGAEQPAAATQAIPA